LIDSPFVRRIPLAEVKVEGKRLGRHIVQDQRSHNFEAEQAQAIASVKHAAYGLPLTQSVGSCTAEALCGARNSEPNYDGTPLAGMPLVQSDAEKLYSLETQNEGSPWPPNDPGGSGLEVCKAAVTLGLISSYDHAFGTQGALQALVLRPVITGVNWYDSMDTPDSGGVVSIAAQAVVRGGHEILADEIDAANELVWFWNSWGLSFGLGGRFAMKFATWDRLLQEQGDVTVPIK
jgi:hypothetical protein